jgi:hypothetical protein
MNLLIAYIVLIDIKYPFKYKIHTFLDIHKNNLIEIFKLSTFLKVRIILFMINLYEYNKAEFYRMILNLTIKYYFRSKKNGNI